MARKQFDEKKYKDELDAARIFEEFIETFQNPDNNTSLSKSWVRGNVYKPQSNEDPNLYLEENKFYKPSPVPILKINQENSTIDIAKECARILPADTKRAQSLKKKKSNLESFKEELELLHKDKIEKQNCEEHMKSFCKIQSNISYKNRQYSTNLFVNNLNLNVTERVLLDIFGKYGAIANVKIMWPRLEDKIKSTNCGFVAYMSRKDAERAMKIMNGKILMDCKLEIDWSKPISLPVRPIYVPPILLELSKPLRSTGLPFNAQPPEQMPMSVTTIEEYLYYCTVQVVIPNDKHILALIHRTIEYVLREGPIFEALIMTKEISNRSFRFLFDNRSVEHVYYRWKLYTILQGEPINKWSMKPFRMFAGGPIWKPPTLLDYSLGIPEELINTDEEYNVLLNRSLSVAQRDCLETLIHKLTPEKNKIAECLIFCMSHSQAYEEIAECIAQSLEKKPTSLRKIIGRLYLISDILCNSKQIAPPNLNIFEKYLPNIMITLSETYNLLTYEPKQLLLNRIMRIFTAWKFKKIYPLRYLEHLQEMFLKSEATSNFKSDSCESKEHFITEESSIIIENTVQKDDITADSENFDIQTNSLPGFITSRWETVDPEIVESQAITSTKWPNYFMKKEEQCLPSKIITEEKQIKQREIEIKVMKYEDKLESGEVSRKPNKTIVEEVEEYRRELITKLEQKMKKEESNSLKKMKGDSAKRSEKEQK